MNERSKRRVRSAQQRSDLLRDNPKVVLGSIAWGLAAALVFTGILWMLAPSAKAVTPSGSGCDDRDIGAVAARMCRAEGWVVRPRLVVGPHGVVRRASLPHCTHEDGSGRQALPCTWNIGSRTDGNGRGLSFWVDRRHHGHYVWDESPRTRTWRWVWPGLADALAEGDGAYATTRRWEACVVRADRVRCADGLVVRR